MTLEKFAAIMRVQYRGWYPPGKPYEYTWTNEESGVYKGKEYYKPAALLINTGEKRFLITMKHGVLQFNEGGENVYDQRSLITDAATLKEIDSYFEKLCQHLYESEKSEKISEPTASLKDLRELCNSLKGLAVSISSKDAESLFEMASSAIDDPKRFFELHKDTFSERGIDAPRNDLYKIFLLNRLIELGAAAEIDWKEEIGTIRSNLGRISAEDNIGANIAETEPAEMALAKIAEELRGKRKMLLQWEIDSDSYCLIVAMAGSADDIIRNGWNVGILFKQKIE